MPGSSLALHPEQVQPPQMSIDSCPAQPATSGSSEQVVISIPRIEKEGKLRGTLRCTLVLEDDAEESFLHREIPAIFVIDKAKFPEFIHEMTDP